MMLLIYKNDGSIRVTNFTDFIQQGNHKVNDIFVSIEGKEPNEYSAAAYFTLPDSTVTTLVGTPSEEPVEFMNAPYNGFIFSLTQNETKYAGIVYMTIEVTLTGSDEIWRSYRVPLTINKTVTDLDETLITLAQYQNLLQYINDGLDDSGIYFTPSVNTDGDLSWTNNGGLPNPETRNIKGPQGNNGADGSDGVGITDITFTSSASSGGNNEITIHLSNGQERTFTVRNGLNGGGTQTYRCTGGTTAAYINSAEFITEIQNAGITVDEIRGIYLYMKISAENTSGPKTIMVPVDFQVLSGSVFVKPNFAGMYGWVAAEDTSNPNHGQQWEVKKFIEGYESVLGADLTTEVWVMYESEPLDSLAIIDADGDTLVGSLLHTNGKPKIVYFHGTNVQSGNAGYYLATVTLVAVNTINFEIVSLSNKKRYVGSTSSALTLGTIIYDGHSYYQDNLLSRKDYLPQIRAAHTDTIASVMPQVSNNPFILILTTGSFAPLIGRVNIGGPNLFFEFEEIGTKDRWQGQLATYSSSTTWEDILNDTYRKDYLVLNVPSDPTKNYVCKWNGTNQEAEWVEEI